MGLPFTLWGSPRRNMFTEESSMKIIRSRRGAAWLCAGVLALIALFATLPTSAQQNNGKAKQAKAGSSRYVSPPGYITGVVQSEKGPEAGVWGIAETNERKAK